MRFAAAWASCIYVIEIHDVYYWRCLRAAASPSDFIAQGSWHRFELSLIFAMVSWCINWQVVMG